jgi:hypothetical protein
MEPASLSSAIDMRLIPTLAKMALQVLDKGQDKPSSESRSRVSPKQNQTQETSCDSSRAKPDGDCREDAGTGYRSATGAPLTLGSADDVHPA